MAYTCGMARGAHDPLAPFHPLTRAWFSRAFAEPTGAQAAGWPHIAAGEHTLILAPTGSGKTLAAFLWAIDRLVAAKLDGAPAARVLYVSPLKALNYDVERNLAGPLAGLADAARREGGELPPISVGVRTGDTPQADRQRMLRTPPDILITTPESLFLLLTSRGTEILKDVGTVIIDEQGWELIPEPKKKTLEAAKHKQGPDARPAHVRNFLDCVKSREYPVENLEVGHFVSTVAHLGNLSLRTGRAIEWDAQTETVKGNDAANELLKANYRAPWKLPV